MWRYLHLNFRCIYYHSMYLSKVKETLFFSIMILCTMALGLGVGTLVGCTPLFLTKQAILLIKDQIF